MQAGWPDFFVAISTGDATLAVFCIDLGAGVNYSSALEFSPIPISRCFLWWLLAVVPPSPAVN
jgi:hypothetical protein